MFLPANSKWLFEARLVLLNDEIGEVEDKVRLLIRKQLTAGEQIQDIYQEELDKLNALLQNMREARERLKGESLAEQTSTSTPQATLEELTLENFWRQESRELLFPMFGKCYLIVPNGEIVRLRSTQVNHIQRDRSER